MWIWIIIIAVAIGAFFGFATSGKSEDAVGGAVAGGAVAGGCMAAGCIIKIALAALGIIIVLWLFNLLFS